MGDMADYHIDQMQAAHDEVNSQLFYMSDQETAETVLYVLEDDNYIPNDFSEMCRNIAEICTKGLKISSKQRNVLKTHLMQTTDIWLWGIE